MPTESLILKLRRLQNPSCYICLGMTIGILLKACLDVQDYRLISKPTQTVSDALRILTKQTSKERATPELTHVDTKLKNKEVTSSLLDSISNSENTIDNSMRFPYNRYSRYGMEWIGIIEELEWAGRNYKQIPTISPETEPFSIGDGTIGPTSPNASRVYFPGNMTVFTKDELVHLIIEARDINGRKRERGGDFFFPVLSSDIQPKRTAGRVIDYGNGTYSVYFLAGWTGPANIEVILYFTREAIHWLNTDVRGKEDRIKWKAHYKFNKFTSCRLVSEGTWENECEYMNPVSLGKTVFLCKHPKNLECQDIIKVYGNITELNVYTNKTIKQSRKMDLFGSHYMKAPFAANPIKIKIRDSVHDVPAKNDVPNPPLCKADLPVPISDGFWKDVTVYEFLSCKARQFSDKEISQCLENRHLWLYGDSTMEQWYIRLLSVFDINISAGVNLYAPKSGIAIGKNTTVFMLHHAMLAHHFGELNSMIFEADLLDRISRTSCNSTVMVMNMNYHLVSWSTRSFIERLLQGRKAVVRLLSECPEAKVMIKMTHPRDNNDAMQAVHSSNWILYDINRIVRRIFGGFGVHFIDIWDMSLSHWSKDTIHSPLKSIIAQQLMLFLSHICPEMAANKPKQAS